MWQKGPGEGYHAAKDETIEIDPSAKCWRHRTARGTAYFVQIGSGRKFSGAIARDAWWKALMHLNERSG